MAAIDYEDICNTRPHAWHPMIKRLQIILLLAVVACGALASEPAWASRGRARVGVFIGPAWYTPFYAPYHYAPYYAPYYPPYYYAPVVTAPPTYIEQAPAIVPGYWYYCSAAQGYYPTVSECPAGWQRVAPEPAN
jgi:hypothetical protein